MATGQTYLVLDSPIPRDLLPLGSLVYDPKHPLDSYFKGLDIQDGPQMYRRIDRNVREMINSNTSSSVRTRLQQLLSLSPSLGKNTVELEAIECRVYRLLNQLYLFNQLVDLPDAREWIQRGLKQGVKVYFVTGYRTFIQGRLRQRNTSGVDISVGYAPIDSILSVSGNVSGISVGPSAGFSSQRESFFETYDEVIFAVSYSLIRIRKLFGVEKASLKIHDKWSAPITLRKPKQGSSTEGKSATKADSQRSSESAQILVIDEVTKSPSDTEEEGTKGTKYIEPMITGIGAHILEIESLPRNLQEVGPVEGDESDIIEVRIDGDIITAHGKTVHTSIGLGSFGEQDSDTDFERSSVTSRTSFWSEVSQSSASSNSSIPGAEEELFHLLLSDEGLKPCYERIVTGHTGDVFERQYYHLLRAYAIELLHDASSPLEVLVVRFIRKSARQLAGLIRRQIYSETGEDNEAIKGLIELVPEKSVQLEQLLSQLPQSHNKGPTDDTLMDEQSDTSDIEESDLGRLSNLEQVKKFLTGGEAFKNLTQSLQLFATLTAQETKQKLHLTEDKGSLVDPAPPVTDEAGLDEGSVIDPLHEPARYFGRLKELEEETVHHCQLRRVLDSLGSSDSFPIQPDTSESGVEETLNSLSTLMKGVLDGFWCLKDAGFCDSEFSLIVQYPSSDNVVRIVPFSEESLVQLLDIDLRKVCLKWETAEGSLSIGDLGEVANEVFSYFGFDFEPPADLESSLRQFSSLVWMLALGLASYSGSHASAFNVKYLKSKDLESGPSEFKIQVDGRAQSENAIILRRVKLACLGEFVGDTVWTFLSNTRGAIRTGDKTVLTSIRSLTDLWGPTRIIYSKEEPGKAIRIEVERGTITRYGEASISEEAVSCHWFKWGTHIPEDIKPFDEDSMLLIGADTMATPPNEFKWKIDCHRKDPTTRGEILQKTSKFVDLGVIEGSWGLDTINFGIGVSKGVVANFGGVFKHIPGRSRKATLLYKWADEYPEPRTLNVRIGLEISACTGNALRVPLWELFQLSVVQEYIRRVLGSKVPKSNERIPSFLKAFDDGFETFVSTWEDNDDFRDSAVVIIRKLLQNLAYTGPTAKGDLLAWFVNGEKDGLQISKSYRHNWIKLLVESTSETTLAVMSSRCLENDYPNGCKHDTTTRSDECSTALRTTIFVEQPQQVQKVLRKPDKKTTRDFPSPNLPVQSRQDSEAQKKLSGSKLKKLTMYRSAKKHNSVAVAAAIAPNTTAEPLGPTSDTSTLAPTPQPPLVAETPVATSAMPADPPGPAAIMNSTKTTDATLGSKKSTPKKKPLKEPIEAKLECGTWYRKLQMPMIPLQPQARIYIIKLEVPVFGQAAHSVVKALTDPDALSYQELTGGLGENEHLVQAWIM